MGTICHEHVVVTSWNEETRAKLIQWIKEMQLENFISVSPTMVNSYWSAICWADGSKEGWADSREGDERRQSFLDWIRVNVQYPTIAYICYGDSQFSDTKYWILEDYGNGHVIPNFIDRAELHEPTPDKQLVEIAKHFNNSSYKELTHREKIIVDLLVESGCLQKREVVQTPPKK